MKKILVTFLMGISVLGVYAAGNAACAAGNAACAASNRAGAAAYGASAASGAAAAASKSGGIANGSEWNNGSMDYTADVRANGSIVFTGCSEGQDLAFRFTPKPGKVGEYTVSAANTDDSGNPFADSSSAKHIRRDGQNLLCLYDNQGQLRDVLSPLSYEYGEIQARKKWSRQLEGQYTSSYDEPLTIGADGTMRFSAINLKYEPVTFNSIITGIIRIDGGTRLQGLWKAQITRDGLKLIKVVPDEFEGLYNPTGEEEVFTWARKDIPRFNFASKILLNDKEFRRLSKSDLRVMRNEIFLHHGYVPTSKDLKEYVADKAWYTPRASNKGIEGELSLIEALNIELIKSVEDMKDSQDSADTDAYEPASRNGGNESDINKYRKEMESQANANLMWMKTGEDVTLTSYAFVDVDNDGTMEVWVRDNGDQDFQGIFSIGADGNVELIQNSDARSELVFFPGAVCATGYYGEGEFREFITKVKNSKPADYAIMHQQINNYSEDQELLEEDYMINDKSVTRSAYETFYKGLGKSYEPKVEWHKFQ